MIKISIEEFVKRFQDHLIVCNRPEHGYSVYDLITKNYNGLSKPMVLLDRQGWERVKTIINLLMDKECIEGHPRVIKHLEEELKKLVG